MPAQALEIKKRIGLVPDESLPSTVTGGEFLEFVGRMYGPRLVRCARDARAGLLELFGVELITAS